MLLYPVTIINTVLLSVFGSNRNPLTSHIREINVLWDKCREHVRIEGDDVKEESKKSKEPSIHVPLWMYSPSLSIRKEKLLSRNIEVIVLHSILSFDFYFRNSFMHELKNFVLFLDSNQRLRLLTTPFDYWTTLKKEIL